MAVNIEGADQLRELGNRLAAADKSLRSKLTNGLRAAAKPIVAEMRADGEGARAAGRVVRVHRRGPRTDCRSRGRPGRVRPRSAEKRSGLRATIAAAVGSSATTGTDRTNLTFRMKSSQLPPSQRTLGKRWNKVQGWRHPVFGHPVYVQQLGRPYFDKVIKANQPLLEAGVRAAMVVPEQILAATEI